MYVKAFFHICEDPDTPEEGEYAEYSGTYESVSDLLEFQHKVNEAIVAQIRAMPSPTRGLVQQLPTHDADSTGAGHDGPA